MPTNALEASFAAPPAPRFPKGLPIDAFMREYWQKKPLLIRAAFPAYRGPLSPPELFAMAGRDEVESRLVQKSGRRWILEQGPFERLSTTHRPGSPPWTLLVQGVNLHHRAADALLRRFDFIPQSRLDDLMISYASDGGGVGPHIDSYDVFLLQTVGHRRWRIGRQAEHRLVATAPLKILADFRPQQEWVLEPGDMLYLPPDYAHEGTALGPCMTCSIGFRAPAWSDLAGDFFHDLADKLDLPGRYRDAGRAPTRTPARLDDHLVSALAARLAKVRWGRTDIAAFLAAHLSEPKPQVFFDPPHKKLSASGFRSMALRHGLALHPKTAMLYTGGAFFINGEPVAATTPAATMPGLRSALRSLANARVLDAAQCQRWLEQPGLPELLHAWHADGWLIPGY